MEEDKKLDKAMEELDKEGKMGIAELWELYEQAQTLKLQNMGIYFENSQNSDPDSGKNAENSVKVLLKAMDTQLKIITEIFRQSSEEVGIPDGLKEIWEAILEGSGMEARLKNKKVQANIIDALKRKARPQ